MRFENVVRSTVMACVFAGASSIAGAAAAQALNSAPAATPAQATNGAAANGVGVNAAAANGEAAAAARPPADDPRAGKNVLNAGPEPRVLPAPGSRDYAAIFGSEDEDEQALAAQEQTLQEQRNQLLILERLFTQKPAGTTSAPPAMMPLNTGSTMRPLAPTPAGSQINGGKIDEMQRRVDSLRREADTLRQGAR